MPATSQRQQCRVPQPRCFPFNNLMPCKNFLLPQKSLNQGSKCLPASRSPSSRYTLHASGHACWVCFKLK